METVGLIGVGKMGAPIADRLQHAGYRLRVYDRSQDRCDASHERGLAVFDSVAAACDGADWALLCLPDGTAVEAAVCGPHGLLDSERPPTMCLDLTSSSPGTTVRLGRIVADRGVTFLDTPMSGGVAGANAGTLTVMVGGSPLGMERIRSLLESFASTVTWAGPLGSGHAAKAINNALSALALTVTAEMIATGGAAGLDADRIVEAFNEGPGRTQASEVKYPRFILSRSWDSEFLLSQMLKDVGIACEMGRATDSPVPLTAVLAQIWRSALTELGETADSTQIAQFLRVPAPVTHTAADSGPGGSPDAVLERLNLSVFASCMMGALELMPVGQQYQLRTDRMLSIVNASTGRSEATRSLASQPDRAFDGRSPTIRQALSALDWSRALASQARLFVPATTLAAELLRQAVHRLDGEAPLNALLPTRAAA